MTEKRETVTPSVLLIAYDAECPFCRSVADWARERDTRGQIVFFPIQNPELLRMAPELGGFPLHEAIHCIDASTRRIFVAGDAWLQMARRLPGWGWRSCILSIPGLSGLTRYLYQRRSAGRCRARAEWR